MSDRIYNIELDGILIGKSNLEKADAPMGVVFGLIKFHDINTPFEFLMNYCETNGVVINESDKKYGFIDTQVIPNLKVFREDGIEVKGIAGSAITGISDEGYEITIHGIKYPFYEEEFPHHVEDYRKQFNK